MVAIATDRRRIEAREDPEGERLAAEAAARYLEARLSMARALCRIAESGTFHLRGCSSPVHYAVQLGIPTADARALVDLGRVLDLPAAEPHAPGAGNAEATRGETVEKRIRSGHVHAENAALVAKVLTEPACVRPGEDWIGWAASMTTSTLRRCVNARLEEVAQGSRALLRIDLHVTARAREEFERARVGASREAGTILTQGQTFALVVDRYLDAFDELRRGEAARRVGPTTEAPGDRYIPASVRRQVLDRSHDRCEVPGCTFTAFLQMAHIRPHAAGGGREADNLLRLCSTHHTQVDAGCLVFRGWRDGRPVFGERVGVAAEPARSRLGGAAPPAGPRASRGAAPGGNASSDPTVHGASRSAEIEPRTAAASEVLDESHRGEPASAFDRDIDSEFDDRSDPSLERGPLHVADSPPAYGFGAGSAGWSLIPDPG